MSGQTTRRAEARENTGGLKVYKVNGINIINNIQKMCDDLPVLIRSTYLLLCFFVHIKP